MLNGDSKLTARSATAPVICGYWAGVMLRVEIAFARHYGLDFFPTMFEVLPYDHMNEIAAYGGFPSRYPHWRFGMHFEELRKTSRVEDTNYSVTDQEWFREALRSDDETWSILTTHPNGERQAAAYSAPGRRNSMASLRALKQSRNESSVTRCPRPSRSVIPCPLR